MFRLDRRAGPLPQEGSAGIAIAVPQTDPDPLGDPQGRRLDYLRLSVTDRCNLRCRYCMPAEGIDHAPRAAVLSLEELERLAGVCVGLGVRKIRITGGEPLVRRGVLDLIGALGRLAPQPELLMTTNGLLLAPHLPALRAAGVRRLNLSLDSLDPETWFRITRRGGHATVVRAIDEVLEAGFGLKLNVVVLPGLNTAEVPDFVNLTRERDLEVRFIEPMPFDGAGRPLARTITGPEILALISPAYELTPLADGPGEVSRRYAVDGHRGRIGIVAGHSRTFCDGCRRLRLDAQGQLRTCLYGRPQADLRALLRDGATDADLGAAITAAIGRRLPDGVAAEQDSLLTGLQSMASLGG